MSVIRGFMAESPLRHNAGESESGRGGITSSRKSVLPERRFQRLVRCNGWRGVYLLQHPYHLQDSLQPRPVGAQRRRLEFCDYRASRIQHFELAAADAELLLIQIVFFQEFRPEVLWRSVNVWPTLWRKVHEIPIGPHRVDMIFHRFSSP